MQKLGNALIVNNIKWNGFSNASPVLEAYTLQWAVGIRSTMDFFGF